MNLLQAATQKGRAAFTLIEMLIVIIILGILAMVIIPQIGSSSDDAKLATLRTNLGTMRNAVELYYAQHNSVYPGVGGAAVFVQQLTLYTDVDGNSANSKTAIIKYGPYLKGGALGKNPFNDKNDATVDETQTDITVKTSGGNTGWKFFVKTGVLIANDGAHDSE